MNILLGICIGILLALVPAIALTAWMERQRGKVKDMIERDRIETWVGVASVMFAYALLAICVLLAVYKP